MLKKLSKHRGDRAGYPLKTAVNFSGDNEVNLVGGTPTPLKNDGVRQLG